MFYGMPTNIKEYQGDVWPGDLIEINKGMMLIEPAGPALVLKADNDKGIYEIMYTRDNYVVGCGRMDIKCVVT